VKIKVVEEEIITTEDRIKEMEALLCDPEIYSDEKGAKEINLEYNRLKKTFRPSIRNGKAWFNRVYPLSPGPSSLFLPDNSSDLSRKAQHFPSCSQGKGPPYVVKQ